MTSRPILQQINIVSNDFEAAVGFYRLLGLDVNAGPPGWPPGTGGRHGDVASDNGIQLDIDNAEFARIWGHAGLKSGEPVIGFSLPTRDAVDDTYQALVAAGHPARLEPYDAFFGARYAIVSDPDGHNIGLMSPIDADRRLTPNRDGRPVTS